MWRKRDVTSFCHRHSNPDPGSGKIPAWIDPYSKLFYLPCPWDTHYQFSIKTFTLSLSLLQCVKLLPNGAGARLPDMCTIRTASSMRVRRAHLPLIWCSQGQRSPEVNFLPSPCNQKNTMRFNIFVLDRIRRGKGSVSPGDWERVWICTGDLLHSITGRVFVRCETSRCTNSNWI